MNNFTVYYQTKDKLFKTLNYKYGIIKTIYHLPYDINRFYLTKGYEANDTDLKRYATDLYNASNELLTTKLINFEYTKEFLKRDNNYLYRSHTTNIEAIFKMATKASLYTHQTITLVESNYFEKCYNAGLMYCYPGIYNCYGYDFKMFYAEILQCKNFRIPTEPGEQVFINNIDDIKEFGFYHVEITSTDPNVNKVFSFSKDNIYFINDIKFVMDTLIKKYQFKITIKLITNVKYNALIYDKKCLISGSKIFKKWYTLLCDLKKEFPKNMLIKMLSSSLWGHLSKYNVIRKTENEIEKEDLSIGMTDKADYIIVDKIFKKNDEVYYKLVSSKQPYKYNIRLKPFVTSYGRIKTALVALKNIDHVVRIHTDGIVFDEPLNHEVIPNLIVEEKTTGYIKFNNIKNYEKVK